MAFIETHIKEIFGDNSVISVDFDLIFENGLFASQTTTVLLRLRLRNSQGQPSANMCAKEILSNLRVIHNSILLPSPLVTSSFGAFKFLVTPTVLNSFEIEYGLYRYTKNIAAIKAWEQSKDYQIQGNIASSSNTVWALTKAQENTSIRIKFSKESQIGYQIGTHEVQQIGTSTEFSITFLPSLLVCKTSAQELKIPIKSYANLTICARIKKDRIAEVFTQ
ncbi:hypothetical protein SS50377_23177 [Spironucleus salmonicida]|uniref:Uncharacterized protein n=1 Tax=Spironucleus salmonicida TaxID=348837 RepID=V6LB48_9EUKA|nr:hypothetical protein SS50377_23177 [Spironucleus salmonicida]|eukprot:EST41647.1 Hypothetical protein SS50377_18733 [Spironucleus salmonicida]